MNADAKSQVTVGRAGDVEPVRVREVRRGAVGGAEQGGDLLSLFDDGAVHGKGLAYRAEGRLLEQAFVAQNLFDRRGQVFGIAFQ